MSKSKDAILAAIGRADDGLQSAGLPTYTELLDAIETSRRFLRAKSFDTGGRDAIAFVLECHLARARGEA